MRGKEGFSLVIYSARTLRASYPQVALGLPIPYGYIVSFAVWELTEQLDSKSMETRWNIYIKGVDNKGVIDQVGERVGERVKVIYW